jgi:hypothetical protein
MFDDAHFPLVFGSVDSSLSQRCGKRRLFGSSWEDAERPALRCYAEVDNDPEVLPITARLVRRDPSFGQLADEAIPTEAEARAVEMRARKEARCRDLLLNAAREHRAPLISGYQIRFFQTDLVYIQLARRRIAFGNANKLI